MGPIADARTDQLVYAAVTGIFEYNFNINKQNGSVKRNAFWGILRDANIKILFVVTAIIVAIVFHGHTQALCEKFPKLKNKFIDLMILGNNAN